MTHIELENYVRTLEARFEARIKELEKPKPVAVEVVVPGQVKAARQMCPHCGVKPNHFFHVRTCNANKKKNNGEKETPS
jgi:hypothetical protein